MISKRALRQVGYYAVHWLKDQVNVRRQTLRNRSNRDAIFIHIPKSAGSSVNTVIEQNGGILFEPRSAPAWIPELKERRIRRFFKNRGLVSICHISLASLVEAGLISRNFLQGAWKFTFVRNPFDRAISLYRYLILKRARQPLPPTTTFSIFCSYLEQRAFEPIGLYNTNGLSQLNPQATWLKDANGAFLCDFVGKVENMDQDFKQVSQTLKLASNGHGVPWENKTSRLPIKSYYSDREMEIVAKVYAEDFERFGYDPSRLPEK